LTDGYAYYFVTARSLQQAYLHAHMRHKTNEFLKRLQLARPEVKKNFRRGANAAGESKEACRNVESLSFSPLGDGPAGME
jgi:hypothetical protein